MNIEDQLKEIFGKEGLSWQKLSEFEGKTDRATFRKKFLGWLSRANNILLKIGYEIKIIKSKPEKKQ